MSFAAVVVTYNRKKLLQECIESLLNQSHTLDSIIVIDNNSTDGTNLLFTEDGIFAHSNLVDYVRLTKNIGGAGGFYEGIKLAYQKNFDWIWVMDDDTIPEPEALSAFYNSLHELNFDPSFLASSVYSSTGKIMNVPLVDTNPNEETGYPEWYDYLSKGLVRVKAATFVSILINRKAIEKVGLPYKEYFIWGDDTEYTLRLTKYYGPAYLLGKSVAIHKRSIIKDIAIQNEDNKNRVFLYYYLYRNSLVNTKEYYGGNKATISLILRLLKKAFLILFQPEVKYRYEKSKIILKGIFGYLIGNYNKEKFEKRFYLDEFKKSNL